VVAAAAHQFGAFAALLDCRRLVADLARAGRSDGARAELSAGPRPLYRSRAGRLGALAGRRRRPGLAQARNSARWSAPKFPLKAKDFTKRGCEKGPRLGAALAAAEEAWIAAGFPADKAALAVIAEAALAAADKS
jgi:hypothetical protein